MSLVYNLSITTLVNLGCKITLYGNTVQINEKDIVHDVLFFASKIALETNGYVFQIIKDEKPIEPVKYDLIENTIVSSVMSDKHIEPVEDVEIDLNEADVADVADVEEEVPVVLVKKTRKPRQKRTISNVAIRRIATSSGAKRVSKDVYDITRTAFESMIDDVIDDANIYKEYFGKKTISADHIKLALENKKNRRF
jgi:histone H3/H4